MVEKSNKNILWFEEIGMKDVSLVGGKNASLGEMISHLSKAGVNVPNGFATTSTAFWYFFEKAGLKDKVKKIFLELNVNNIKDLQERGKEVRSLILKTKIPEDLEREILENYHKLSKKYNNKFVDVAVRTSATAEDSPSASFAGQYWTYLNVRGDKALMQAMKGCFASLFTDRAIFYRAQHKFDQLDIALSVGIQKMVRSDAGAAGVMFSLDTESGFKDVVLIDGSYGLGEMIVQGEVTTDEFYVFKPTLKNGYESIISKTLGTKEQKFIYNEKGGIKKVKVSKKEREKFCLSDKEILTLSKWACSIEEHYSKVSNKWVPMDMEWAKDGITGELFIVQARPETVHSQGNKNYYEEYHLTVPKNKYPILEGIAVGSKITSGKVKKILNASGLKNFKKGEILVTKMTDPDWVPAMKIASAIITDEGSRSCHAAIISRELNIPCIVGTGNGTKILKDGETITVNCSRGLQGEIYNNKLPFVVNKYNLEKIPKLKTKIMVNLGAPEIAFKTSFLPVDGVGLAREEFIIAEKIKIHPLALKKFEKIKKNNNPEIKKIVRKINELTVGYNDKSQYFVDKLAEGIGIIAASFYPKKVIVRFSDFKTNEYKQLIGGELFEPEEDNPMLGWRGASRYYNPKFEPAFSMEVKAIKKVREKFGLKNVVVMVPFCRTIEEGKKVMKLMEKYGLKQHQNGLEAYVMCEIPSNVILINEFLDIFDGMSIGSNDLTQLTLGLDRDNGQIASIGNEENEAIKEQVKKVIRVCRKRKKYVGICGQAPSDFPDFAEFIMKEGIETMSLNSDTVIKTILNLSKE